MIIQLPQPLDGSTHIDIAGGSDQQGALSVTGTFGNMGTIEEDGELVPAFVPKPNRVPFSRTISGWERDVFDAFVAAQGAPVIDGVQSYRNTDLIGFFVVHELFDITKTVPAPAE